MFQFLFDTEGFPPRWECGTAWQESPWLGWLHIVADVATASAYIAIPVLMIVALRRVKHLPAPRLLTLFAIFILACGSVHIIEAIIFWVPIYRLSAVAKVTTAISSCITAVVLAYAWPRLLEYRSPEELQREVDRRTEELADTALRLNNTRLMLEEQKERLGLALDAGSMGTWDWNLETDEILFDAAEVRLTELTGRPDVEAGAEIIASKSFFDIVHADDRLELEAAVRNSIDHCRPYSHTFRIVTASGVTRWISGRGSLIEKPGRERRLVGVNFDVTPQKDVETKLSAARVEAEAASKAKSRFLANTSHEIRTPLTAILGCAESLVRNAPDGATAETAGLIQRQGKLLLRLLDDVLDLSRIEAGRMTVRKDGTCDLHSLLQDVRSMMQPQATAKQIEFELQIADQTPRFVRTDPIRLRQIALNLVSNAIKFTDLGRVAITADIVDNEPDQESDQQRELRLTICDTGCGIPDDEQSAIFEAFHQCADIQERELGDHSNNRGTGLGLAIVAKLTQLLGGQLEVESQPNVGSTFTIRLPLAEPSADEIDATRESTAKHPAYNPTAPFRQGRIIVADDTPSIQFLLTKILAKHATSLDLVDDGQAALERIEAAEGCGEPYDAIVLDMHMPIMSGYEVARRVRLLGLSTPIIALTASALVGDRERCLEAGCTAYVPKPIDWDTLESEVQLALAKSADESSATDHTT